MRSTTTRSPSGFPRIHGLALVLSVVSALLFPGLSHAVIHDWVAIGEVVARNGPVFAGTCLSSATAGATARLDYQFDDAAADLAPSDATLGQYASGLSWKLSFPGPGDEVLGNIGGVQIYDDRPLQSVAFMDLYEVTLFDLAAAPVDCSATNVSVTLQLYDETLVPSAALTSDAQPTTPPNVGDFLTTREIALGADASAIQIGVTALYPLGSSSAPVLPTSTQTLPSGNVRWFFGTTCIAGCWFDPPFADGFVYATDGASLFTSIDDFPSGFGAPFEVWVDGSLVGSFGPGQSVDFSGYPGGGVEHFSVRGITPGVDVEDVQAFPLQLSLDTSPASFTMTSIGAGGVPLLPGVGWVVLAAALVGIGAARAR